MKDTWQIATIGATISGNKGAALMLQGVLDNLPAWLGEVRFSVLSVYPDEDKRLNDCDCVEIVPARPVMLVLAVPLAMLWTTLQKLRVDLGPLGRNPFLRALDRCDVLIDLSGISFVDGRTVELGYNVACILPALVMGKRVVKYSQAMGPFRTVLNKTLAQTLLSRVDLIIARGEKTLEYLENLGLQNITLCADSGFSINEGEEQGIGKVLASLDRFGNRKIVGISASSVVEARTRRRDTDYIGTLSEFADRAIERGYGIWLIAHSVKESQRGGRTDDVTTCQGLYQSIQQKQYCQLLIEDYPPATLRAIIGECDFLVASRFHAMVSALAKGIPTIAISWSHKYTEVLEMFELEEWVVECETLSLDNLWSTFQKLVRRRREVKDKIAQHLPEVMASSRRNAAVVASLIEGK